MKPALGSFYHVPLSALLGFGKHAVGVNTLDKYMQLMCSVANIDVVNTVDILAVLVVARALYDSGFDDKAIVARSGHCNDAVLGYKRPSFEQELSVSRPKALDMLDDE